MIGHILSFIKVLRTISLKRQDFYFVFLFALVAMTTYYLTLSGSPWIIIIYLPEMALFYAVAESVEEKQEQEDSAPWWYRGYDNIRRDACSQ